MPPLVGAQKVVPELDTALRRVETYAYPLEDVRARAAYGYPSAMSEVLIVNGDHVPGRTRVLLLRQAIRLLNQRRDSMPRIRRRTDPHAIAT